jgi:hypothetical protein
MSTQMPCNLRSTTGITRSAGHVVDTLWITDQFAHAVLCNRPGHGHRECFVMVKVRFCAFSVSRRAWRAPANAWLGCASELHGRSLRSFPTRRCSPSDHASILLSRPRLARLSHSLCYIQRLQRVIGSPPSLYLRLPSYLPPALLLVAPISGTGSCSDLEIVDRNDHVADKGMCVSCFLVAVC